MISSFRAHSGGTYWNDSNWSARDGFKLLPGPTQQRHWYARLQRTLRFYLSKQVLLRLVPATYTYYS